LKDYDLINIHDIEIKLEKFPMIMNYCRKAFIAIFLSGSIVLTIIGMFWLSIGLLSIAILCFFSISDIAFIVYYRKTKWITYPFYILIVFILPVIIRVFLFEVYTIQSDSMEDTIISGDKILLNKLTYGPLLPVSPIEIPWVNIAFYLN
jgi:signal peptidase I